MRPSLQLTGLLMTRTKLFFFLGVFASSACETKIVVGGNGGDGGEEPAGGSPTTGGFTPVGGGPTVGGGGNGGAIVGGAGGMGGSIVGGFGGDGGFGGEGGTGGNIPVECSALPSPPIAWQQHFGFTGSEDFVFDSLGNYASVDENGNLVRITKAGQKSLWVPAIGFGTAGMVALPDDSVVICDVSNGALKRAFPSGQVQTLIGGLNYPNGIDVGPDGFIYVAEDSGNRLRRVHPDTGASTVVVTLPGPNGVAFTDDPTVVYVGSYSNGVIYKVVQPTPGQPGTYTTFVQSSQFEGGGIDGMGVDKCGNVYAAEFVSGNVYRITPSGVVSIIADLPSSWIPNIKWGRGVGGFDTNVMYVADRNQGSLFAIQVQVEGVDEYFDL